MQKTLPASDTLELSLFGCGVGESLALHLGNNDWAIVDSCRLNRNSEPLALGYLRECGVDPASSVKLIVLTHWHDDHVDGASHIVEACPVARVAISAACTVDELGQILGLYSLGDRLIDRRTSGVHELGKIMRIAEQRMLNRASRDSSPAVIPTQADHILYRSGDRELVALAPSHGSIHVARMGLAGLIAELLSTPNQARVLPASARNDFSVALWLKWGDKRALLGGDLEVSIDKGRGWNAVISCQQFPDKKANIFKIAHHGSENGDDSHVWDELIAPSPLAMLTSYSRGTKPLPSSDDLLRIQQRANKLYYTALPARASGKRDRAVEKTIAGVARSRRVLARAGGHVRVRWLRGAGAPIVECSGTAKAA
jgi:beta-lactamase superfamily II metal-dependent hydrolase